MRRIYTILIFAAMLFNSPVFAQINRELTREKSTTNTPEKRLALVIGNGAYKNASTLPNPVNDATDMAATLKDLNFEVISGTNLTKQQMEKLIREFGTRLAETKAVGLFFYAGHGIAAGGTNYLIPVDADIQAEDEIEYSSVSINFVLGKMAAANNGFNMVILDACRNNPFARKWRNYRDTGDKGGLTRIDAPTGTLIAYATKPGDVASDGNGRNGLYTGALLKQMRVKNVDITKMFQYVRADVIKQSGGKQVPFDESSVVGDFYFAGNDNPNSQSNSTVRSEPFKTEPLPSAEEVLNDYYKAVGGERVKNISTFVLKGSVEIDYNGQKILGQTESYIKIPGKFLTISKFSNGNWTKDVYDGDSGWISSKSGGTKNATPQQIQGQKCSSALYFGDIDTVKKCYSKMTVTSRAKFEDKDLIILEAVTPDGKTSKIYFDASTKLISRMDFSQTSVSVQQGVSFMTELYFENYVSLDGVQVPLISRQKVTSGLSAVFKYDVLELKFGIPLDDKLFKKP